MAEKEFVWKCEKCGVETPGTSEGSAQMLQHFRSAKKKGEEGHRSVLADIHTGEIVENDSGNPVRSLSQAQALGFVHKKDENEGKQKGKITPSQAAKGQFKPEVIDLDTRIRFLYEWDRIIVPEMTQDIGEWIFDCIMGFHIQNRERLKFDVLIKEAM
jgi:hypothetical protein